MARAQNVLAFTVTEQTLVSLLIILAFILLIVLVLYRKQRKLGELLLQESRTDHLTQISNRRHFFELLDNYVSLAKRHDQSLGFLAIDIDHFKNVNDTYGHTTGDQVLQQVATTLNNNTRAGDCVGRIGGEEFAVLLPMTNNEGSHIFAERIRSQIENLDLSALDKEVSVTISIGVSNFSAELTPTLLYQSADEALYKAKESGRNCVVPALAH